jgi:hypothetical protein
VNNVAGILPESCVDLKSLQDKWLGGLKAHKVVRNCKLPISDGIVPLMLVW